MEKTPTIGRHGKIIDQYEDDFESMEDYWGTLFKEFEKDTEFLWMNKQWDQTAVDDRKRSTSNNGDALPPRPTDITN